MYEGLGASVQLWSCIAQVQVLVPVRTPSPQADAGPRTHPPHLGGFELQQLRMVSGELPGVRGGKGSPRVDYVDRYPSRGHFSSQNKFRVRVPKSKPEAVAPSPKPPPRGRNRPDAGLAKKKSARNSASRSEREIKPRLACYCSKL